MGFLERAIRRGISEGVGKAVGNAIGKAVEPAATNLANKAADNINRASQNTQKPSFPTAGLEGAMANLERSVQGYATEAAKNTKVCPSCGRPNGADKKFCADCGTQLPEQTLAQGAVCTECGTQNGIGTKFCQNCGAKLPATIQEEQAQADRNAAVMAEWDVKLAHYPKWSCGGEEFDIEEYDSGCFAFRARFKGNSPAAHRAVEEYRQILLQNGFRQAGEYPNIENLYKMENGVCYHVDTGMCFESSPDSPSIYFDTREPSGGFNYVKPAPKKKSFFGF